MEGENESLSTEEAAYFDSRGESEIKATPEPKPEVVDEPVLDDHSKSPPEGEEPESDAEPEAEKPQAQKTVPLAALTKERAERKQEKARIAELERLNSTWQDRWNQALQPREEQAPEEPVIPSPEDPMGRINWLVDQISNGQKQSKEQQARNEQQQAVQQVLSRVNDDYTTAAKADPTVSEAHNAWRMSMGRELMAMGRSEEQAVAEIRSLENQHAIYVTQNRIPIAEHIKAMAGTRGWAPKPVAEEKKDPATEVGDLADKLDASTSMQNSGGGAPKVLDAQTIANMSPDDFEKWLSKPGNQQKFKRLAGG